MPKKIVKTHTGRIVEIYSILLPNGNLLIPGRNAEDRTQAEWQEFPPGTSEYKRWFGVSEAGSDPRKQAKA